MGGVVFCFVLLFGFFVLFFKSYICFAKIFSQVLAVRVFRFYHYGDACPQIVTDNYQVKKVSFFFFFSESFFSGMVFRESLKIIWLNK